MPDRDAKPTEARRDDAYARVGVTRADCDAAPRIRHLLRRLPHGEADAIRVLRGSASDEARRFFLAYDDPVLSRSARNLLPIEAFCLAAGVPPIRLFEIVMGEAVQQGMKLGNVIAAIAHPDIVQRTIDSALVAGPEGTAEREMLLKHAAFLPTPKGAQINILNAPLALGGTSAQPLAAPRPEDMTRRLAQRFNALTPGDLDGVPRLPEIIDADVEEVPADLPRTAASEPTVVYADRIAPPREVGD